MQRIGFFLLALVVVALVAGLYLYITAQTATAGVEIQNLEARSEELRLQIADLKTQLGRISSAAAMEQRALEMGFEKTTPENTAYLVVADYPGRQTAILAPPPSAEALQAPLIKAAYTESLWDWLFRGMLELGATTSEVTP